MILQYTAGLAVGVAVWMVVGHALAALAVYVISVTADSKNGASSKRRLPTPAPDIPVDVLKQMEVASTSGRRGVMSSSLHRSLHSIYAHAEQESATWLNALCSRTYAQLFNCNYLDTRFGARLQQEAQDFLSTVVARLLGVTELTVTGFSLPTHPPVVRALSVHRKSSEHFSIFSLLDTVFDGELAVRLRGTVFWRFRFDAHVRLFHLDGRVYCRYHRQHRILALSFLDMPTYRTSLDLRIDGRPLSSIASRFVTMAVLPHLLARRLVPAVTFIYLRRQQKQSVAVASAVDTSDQLMSSPSESDGGLDSRLLSKSATGDASAAPGAASLKHRAYATAVKSKIVNKVNAYTHTIGPKASEWYNSLQKAASKRSSRAGSYHTMPARVDDSMAASGSPPISADTFVEPSPSGADSPSTVESSVILDAAAPLGGAYSSGEDLSHALSDGDLDIDDFIATDTQSLATQLAEEASSVSPVDDRDGSVSVVAEEQPDVTAYSDVPLNATDGLDIL